MNSAIRWFDRLRSKAAELRHSAVTALPGFVDMLDHETEEALDSAEVMVVSGSAVKRLLGAGAAPSDLVAELRLPFTTTLFMPDAAVAFPGERGEGLLGVLVTAVGEDHRVQAWFEEKRSTVVPRCDSMLSSPQTESDVVVAGLIYWLAAYVNSPGVVGIRHNPDYGAAKRRRAHGRPLARSYYTFSPVQESAKVRNALRAGESSPRLAQVHGHFRRAHWHTLPLGRGSAWYPTTWVRPYRRRVNEEPESRMAA